MMMSFAESMINRHELKQNLGQSSHLEMSNIFATNANISRNISISQPYESPKKAEDEER
jgi:hypothetical protein